MSFYNVVLDVLKQDERFLQMTGSCFVMLYMKRQCRWTQG